MKTNVERAQQIVSNIREIAQQLKVGDSVKSFISYVLPREYSIPNNIVEIKDVPLLEEKTKVSVFGYADKIEEKPINSAKMSSATMMIYKDGHSVLCRWIMPKGSIHKFIAVIRSKMLSHKNSLLQATGKIDKFKAPSGHVVVFLNNPQIEFLDTKHTQKYHAGDYVYLQPKYPLKKTINHYTIQTAFKKLIENMDHIHHIVDFMPEELERELDLQPLKKSLEYIHCIKPIPRHKIESFLSYEGFLKRVEAEIVWDTVKKMASIREHIPSNFSISEEDIENIKNMIKEKIPFELTKDQKKAVWGILQHMSKNGASKSLLFGDVGTGKTMVAHILSEVIMKQGHQVAFITPTSILAKQHYQEALQIFGENVFLVTGETKKRELKKISKVIESGSPCVIFGTTAIKGLPFSNLRLIVIDEEQKMGVDDKEYLYEKYYPQSHILYMTATPIPRTMTQAIFSDFASFRIQEKPSIQKPRITKIIQNVPSADEIAKITHDVLNDGSQSLVIVPSIVSEDMANIENTMHKYQQLFPKFSIGFIHGKLNDKEIASTVELFMSGSLHMLIATTMVDSGFSNKNLSYVFIESPDRFGLSQIHQIRGRVGRGEKQGVCYLCLNRPLHLYNDATKRRMEIVAHTEDGFYLAKEDLALRGTGDIVGKAQSSKNGKGINLLKWEREMEVMKKYLNKLKLSN